jgi:hypothetical protein
LLERRGFRPATAAERLAQNVPADEFLMLRDAIRPR